MLQELVFSLWFFSFFFFSCSCGSLSFTYLALAFVFVMPFFHGVFFLWSGALWSLLDFLARIIYFLSWFDLGNIHKSSIWQLRCCQLRGTFFFLSYEIWKINNFTLAFQSILFYFRRNWFVIGKLLLLFLYIFQSSEHLFLNCFVKPVLMVERYYFIIIF